MEYRSKSYYFMMKKTNFNKVVVGKNNSKQLNSGILDHEKQTMEEIILLLL